MNSDSGSFLGELSSKGELSIIYLTVTPKIYKIEFDIECFF